VKERCLQPEKNGWRHIFAAGGFLLIKIEIETDRSTDTPGARGMMGGAMREYGANRKRN
jgi:hypothetical protein